jgi:hypothetical protein
MVWSSVRASASASITASIRKCADSIRRIDGEKTTGALIVTMRMGRVAAAICACSVAVAFSLPALAQVPVHLEPRHPVAFENSALRVLNVNIAGDDTTLDHIHENDIAIVCISGCEIRTLPLGGSWGDWVSRQPGQVGLNANTGQPSIHRHQAGRNLYHVISVENLRQRGWSQDIPTSSPGTRLVDQTRAFQIYDVRVDAGATVAGGVHSQPLVTVLISGQVAVDTQGEPAKSLKRPGDWTLIAADAARMVNSGGTDAYLVEIEVR